MHSVLVEDESKTDHNLQVRVGEVSYQVEKRFSQFQAMHVLLVAEGVDRCFVKFVSAFKRVDPGQRASFLSFHQKLPLNERN